MAVGVRETLTLLRLLLCTATSQASSPCACNDITLVVHEWGTFTSLQDENGDAIGGINTDDEPVPAFVHNIANRLLIPPTEAPPSFFQGAPRCHPDVTMRLETPVIYFYPPKSFKAPVDVSAQFHGGWLTQYFPDATANAPGISENKFGALTAETIGTLSWWKLALNVEGEGPVTNDQVWTAPRRVESVMLQAGNRERERFLFYRGVAHCDAPLRVVREQNQLRIVSNFRRGDTRHIWLTDIRADGTSAFRAIRFADTATPAEFQPADYSAENTERLKSALRSGLIADGLFPEEAEALLETWSLSYFKSAGLRLFFLVPRKWTDEQLPLTIAPKANITRVMVGRIEIVTPAQRALLSNIAAGPAPDSYRGFRDQIDARLSEGARQQDWSDLDTGRKSFADLGFSVPELYQNYLQLGRFRNALILDEQKRRPTVALDQFIKNFGLSGYSY